MKAYIHHIETLVPETAYTQDYACERMERWVGDPTLARVVRMIYRRSGIAKRHSVLRDFIPGETAGLFRESAEGRLNEPSTEERNRIYIRAANELCATLARNAVARAGIRAADITHVVTVSCTGFYNPGPDHTIVRSLGLSETTERYHIGFMGCYGAFPGLRMARQFCLANPHAVVLVVCLELCSLHMQIKLDPDTLLANALFADGAAAAIVSARPPAPGRSAFAIDQFMSALAPEGGKDMAWEIGNNGFNIVLSSYVPDVIAANVEQIVDDLLARTASARDEIDVWAIHPGGKAILDKVEKALALRPPQLDAARAVLREYGNMSSATILFVLQRLLDDPLQHENRICTMAFGPGLVIETALLQRVVSEPFHSSIAPETAAEVLACVS
jgi:predicted naringenin-chalcone synthase